jgi:hypothetical protein
MSLREEINHLRDRLNEVCRQFTGTEGYVEGLTKRVEALEEYTGVDEGAELLQSARAKIAGGWRSDNPDCSGGKCCAGCALIEAIDESMRALGEPAIRFAASHAIGALREISRSTAETPEEAFEALDAAERRIRAEEN